MRADASLPMSAGAGSLAVSLESATLLAALSPALASEKETSPVKRRSQGRKFAEQG